MNYVRFNSEGILLSGHSLPDNLAVDDSFILCTPEQFKAMPNLTIQNGTIEITSTIQSNATIFLDTVSSTGKIGA